MLLFGCTLTAFILGSLAATCGIAVMRRGEMSPPYLFLGIMSGGIIAGIVRVVAKAILPDRAGHVRSCIAFGGGSATQTANGSTVEIQLNLRNRAFARLWIIANGSGVGA